MTLTRHFEAIIADLDGVVTRTAAVHARTWKRVFDEYLQSRSQATGDPFRPFDIQRDYREYVDGRPRYDGVRTFLESRGIRLPEGKPEDAPDRETICGLGNRKNRVFHTVLEQEGVEVYEDAVAAIRGWRELGLKTAVVSSSRNCAAVLSAAGLTDLFDVRVDGAVAHQLGLPGKPAPDYFLEAARRLQVDPAKAVAIEDAVAGVQAARAGGFGLVVGVVHDGDVEALLRGGADVVVSKLTELEIGGVGEWASERVSGVRQRPDTGRASESGFGYGVSGRSAEPESRTPNPETRAPNAPSVSLPDALEHWDEIASRLRSKRLAVFLDYDGTLTPIVERPEDARLAPDMRACVAALASRQCVAVVSGRDRQVVEGFVKLGSVIYAGSHGFDIAGPVGLHLEHEEARGYLPDLESAEQELEGQLRGIPGAQVERKRFGIAVHYRRVADPDVADVERIVDQVRSAHPKLRKRGGKKIFELQPDIDWDKGKAVLWLLDALKLDRPNVLPIYVGDDLTDEDAFRALKGRGLGIVVEETETSSLATYCLRNTAEVQRFLQKLTKLGVES